MIRRDNSFGEVNQDTRVGAYVAGFIPPTISGMHHLVLDMDQQVLGNDGLNEDLLITVRRNGANLEIHLANLTSPGVFSGLYHSVVFADVLSLTIRGSDEDNETLIVDLTTGDAIPPGGISFDGRGNTATGDALSKTLPDRAAKTPSTSPEPAAVWVSRYRLASMSQP